MFAQDFDEFGPFGWGRRGRGGFGPGRGSEAFGAFRAGRGMMEPAILSALGERPMHGYEIISFLEDKSHGMWRPSPGSVYPTLQLLEEKDFVEYIEQDGKKTYQLTGSGKKEAEASREQFQGVFERFGEADRREGRRMNLNHEYQRQFHRQAGEIFKLVRQIFRKGSVEQKAALEDAINDFKARLEHISKGEIA